MLLLGEAWGENPRGLATKYRIRIIEVREKDRDFRLLCAPGHLHLKWHRVPVSKHQLFLRLFPPAQLPCGLGPSNVYSSLCFPPPSAREQGEVGPAHPGAAANGKSDGPSAKQGLDGGDGECVKTRESLPYSAHLPCNLEKHLGWREYSRKWQPPQDLRWGRMYTPVPRGSAFQLAWPPIGSCSPDKGAPL